MGTNYYARYWPCKLCHRCSGEKHIGKSSARWRFLFQSHWDISSWEDWKRELRQIGVEIWDEYNTKLTFEELSEIIENKQRDERNQVHCNEKYHWQDGEGYDFARDGFS